MTDHDDDRRPDEAKADEVERELDAMGERHERLGEDIEDTGEAWERKQKDERVPGATGEPEGDDEDEESGDGDELDFGRALAEDDEGEG
jgi:hypothetical protein